MKVVNAQKNPQRICNAPGGCAENATHMVTVQPDTGRFKYKSYSLCDRHLRNAEDASNG